MGSDKVQICLATEQVNITWLIDSPTNPQSRHLESIIIPLEEIIPATEMAPLITFHKNDLIFWGRLQNPNLIIELIQRMQHDCFLDQINLI